MRKGSRLAAIFAAVLQLALVGAAEAQPAAPAFPAKPLTIVVPFQAGGATDVVVRLVGQKVSENLKLPVIIDNRPGAGGVIAGEAVRKAPPDGYTLLLGTTGTHAVAPALNSKLPYDPIQDFQPITQLVFTKNVLVVPAGGPLHSVQDIVKQAKAKAGGLSFASQGMGSGGHLLGEMLKAQTNAPLVHVLYKGSAPALADVLAGRVDLFFDALITSLPYIRDGKLRPLAMASSTRSALLPDVPTMAELGFGAVKGDNWFGLFVVSGTPTPLVERLHREFVRAANDPDVRRKLAEGGMDVNTSTPSEFAALIREDTERLGKIVRDSGARAN